MTWLRAAATVQHSHKWNLEGGKQLDANAAVGAECQARRPQWPLLVGFVAHSAAQALHTSDLD